MIKARRNTLVRLLAGAATLSCAALPLAANASGDNWPSKNITMVVVDRGGNKYTGRVAAIVEACVAGGVSISSKTVKEAE